MRLHRLARPAAIATLVAGALASPALAVQPPAGIPDLSAMTLTVDDLPAGAVVQRRGYVREPGTQASYAAGFTYSGKAMRRSGLLLVRSAVELFKHSDDALLQFVLADAALSDRGTRLRVAREIARDGGLPAKNVTVGRPRELDMGDGALQLPITVRQRGRRLTVVVAIMALDRATAELDVLGAPGSRHLMRRTRSMLAVMRDRIRRGLSPVSSSPPAITGSPQTGGVLHAEPGVWSDATGPSAFAYQWQRCDATGAACSAIAGATGQDYTVATQDAGATLRVAVTARNRVGKTTAVSGAIAVTG